MGVVQLRRHLYEPPVHPYAPPIHLYAPRHPNTPIYLYAPILPVHLYVLCSPYVMGTWSAPVNPICLGVFWGVSVHLSGISVSVSTYLRRGLLFQVWFHPMTQSTLNLQWALNLVWWLGIRLMSLLIPGLQSSLLLIPTFILHSLLKCHH